jgi:hypothetical protein
MSTKVEKNIEVDIEEATKALDEEEEETSIEDEVKDYITT